MGHQIVDGKIKESTALQVTNPVVNPAGVRESSFTGGVDPSTVKAIYPLIRSINSEKLTRNFTYYPQADLKGNDEGLSGTGFRSFVKPYGKPILTEHRSSDDWTPADVPMGRIVASSYVSAKQEKRDITPSPKGYPGFIEGDGSLQTIAAITQPDAIEKVLSRVFHTVSIGAMADKVIESISGKDLVELSKKGDWDEYPSYVKGQMYDGKLSYWIIKGIRGEELSYVNSPADTLACNMDTDLGINTVRLMLGDKKVGANEFLFYDAKTNEKIKWNTEDTAVDESYFNNDFEPSVKRAENVWVLNPNLITESFNTVTLESMVTWGPGEGKVVAVLTEGVPTIIKSTIAATKENPVAIVKIYKEGKATDKHCVQRLKSLKLLENK